MIKRVCFFLLLGIAVTGYSFDTVDQGRTYLEKTKKSGGTKLELGKIYHDLASIELKAEWIDLGCMHLEDAFQSTANPEALAYWGSLITIEGNLKYLKGDLLGALSSLDIGGKKIDQAIMLDETNIDLRFLRVINGLSVGQSSPVDRSEVVNTDIQYISTKTHVLSMEEKSMFYFYKGLKEVAQEQILEALESFDLAIQSDPKSKYAGLAKKELARWEE